ncbi:MAG: D-alanine--D-alanine ligase [Chromatiales bacterium]
MRRPEEFGKVAVLLGGISGERIISLESGTAVHTSLRRVGVDAHMVDWQGGHIGTLIDERFERVFVVLHGRGGEDGQIQGYLDTLGLPYTGSGVLGSALAMDKVRAKHVWMSLGLPTPAFQEFTAEPDAEALVRELGLPLMMKPVREGSSLGATKVTRENEVVPAWRNAAKHDRRVMAEQWIAGGEYTAALVAGQALPLIKLETPRVFYNYEAKYHDERTRYLCPCGLLPVHETAMQCIAQRAFAAVDGRGWGRVDMLVDEHGSPWLIEANTIPGMTSHSLVPMAAKAAGMSFEELVLAILETTLSTAEGGAAA